MSKEQLAQYSELAGKQVEVGDFMGYVMKYMLDKGLKLDNTEGMIEASVFPVNYFTVKQVRAVDRAAGVSKCVHDDLSLKSESRKRSVDTARDGSKDMPR